MPLQVVYKKSDGGVFLVFSIEVPSSQIILGYVIDKILTITLTFLHHLYMCMFSSGFSQNQLRDKDWKE